MFYKHFQACSKHACWVAQESAELQVRVAAQTVNRDDIVRMTTERCGPRSPGHGPPAWLTLTVERCNTCTTWQPHPCL